MKKIRLDAARRFEDQGVKRLHVVDLDGAKAKHIVNYNTLERISIKNQLVVDFGGGIKSDNDLKIVFDCGAAMAVIGSIAVTDRDLFQTGCLLMDLKKSFWVLMSGTGRLRYRDGRMITEIGLFDFLTYYKGMGIKQVLCTDIAKDGMMKGSSVELYKQMVKDFPSMRIIASGGSILGR